MRTKQENLDLFKKYFAPYEIVSQRVYNSFADKDKIYDLFDDRIVGHMVYLRVGCFKKPVTVNDWYDYIDQLDGITVKELEDRLTKERGHKVEIYEFRGYREPECVEGAKFSAHRASKVTGKCEAFDFQVQDYSAEQVRDFMDNRFIKDLPHPIRIEDNVSWNHHDVRAGKNSSRKINYFTV